MPQRSLTPERASASASSRSPSPVNRRHHKHRSHQQEHGSRKKEPTAELSAEEIETVSKKVRRSSRPDAAPPQQSPPKKQRHSRDKMATSGSRAEARKYSNQEPPWVDATDKPYDDVPDTHERRGRGKQVPSDRRRARASVTSSDDGSSASRSSRSVSRTPVKKQRTCKTSAPRAASRDGQVFGRKPIAVSNKQRRREPESLTPERPARKRREYDDDDVDPRDRPRNTSSRRYVDERDDDAGSRYQAKPSSHNRKRSKESRHGDVSVKDDVIERSRSRLKPERVAVAEDSVERDDVTHDAKASRYDTSHDDYRWEKSENKRSMKCR